MEKQDDKFGKVVNVTTVTTYEKGMRVTETIQHKPDGTKERTFYQESKRRHCAIASPIHDDNFEMMG